MNQPLETESVAQKEKDMDPDTRHKQRNTTNTEVETEVETKPGTEEDRKRNMQRDTLSNRPIEKSTQSWGPKGKIRD